MTEIEHGLRPLVPGRPFEPRERLDTPEKNLEYIVELTAPRPRPPSVGTFVTLTKHQVDYVVIGGHGAFLHDYEFPWASQRRRLRTSQTAVCVRRGYDNEQRLADALVEAHIKTPSGLHPSPICSRAGCTIEPQQSDFGEWTYIEFFTDTMYGWDSYDELAQHADEIELLDTVVKVAVPADDAPREPRPAYDANVTSPPWPTEFFAILAGHRVDYLVIAEHQLDLGGYPDHRIGTYPVAVQHSGRLRTADRGAAYEGPRLPIVEIMPRPGRYNLQLMDDVLDEMRARHRFRWRRDHQGQHRLIGDSYITDFGRVDVLQAVWPGGGPTLSRECTTVLWEWEYMVGRAVEVEVAPDIIVMAVSLGAPPPDDSMARPRWLDHYVTMFRSMLQRVGDVGYDPDLDELARRLETVGYECD